MFKKLAGLILSLFLLILPVSVFGAQSRVIDREGLFSSSEINALEQKAEVLSKKYGTDVFIVTDSQYGYSSNFARDYLEQYGVDNYPNGYIGYMINMADRSFWVDAYGNDERSIFTQPITDQLSELAYQQLRMGDYAGSAMAVLNEIGNQYELAGPLGFLKKPFLYPGKAFMLTGMAGIFALAIAGIATGMKTARHQDKAEKHTAAQYGSGFALTANNNRFIRRYQTRVPRPRVQQRRGGSGFGGGGMGGGGGSGHTGSGGHF